MDIKKQMNFERKLPKDDREIYTSLKPIARFLSVSEFDNLFEGLVLEKNLRQRLSQLKTYQELGLKTFEDIDKYLDYDSYKKNKDKVTLPENGENKVEKEINSNEISITEKDFIKRKNISQELFNEIKQRLSKESRNSIKSTIIGKFSCTKEDIDQIADFIVKLKK